MASQIHIKGYLVDDKGTWTVRARYTDAESGKRKLFSKSTGLKVDGHNKRKAEALMREIVEGWEQQVNAVRPTENPKFKDCISQWMERKKLTLLLKNATTGIFAGCFSNFQLFTISVCCPMRCSNR